MENISVRELGNFYVGGHEVILRGLPHKTFICQDGTTQDFDPNGQYEAGQMYVEYVKLAQPKAKYPLLMWHGGGLTGATWGSTPDGREGWRSLFLRYGHDVYVSDSVERGRSSWAMYPEIYRTPPEFTTKAACWSNFRMGPVFAENHAERIPYAGTQFPMKYYDEFCKQIVPRWRSMDDWAQDAYNNLVDRFDGGCVIMAHSQGANFALPAALAHPDKVKGLILLEPARTPDPQTTDFSALKEIPQLVLWGDFIRVPELCAWTKAAYFKIYPEYFRIMKELGMPITWIDLPKRGIFGNTHLLMMDRNSVQVAEMVQSWMTEKGLMK
ncbi:alpha/beta fold hydrolase [Pyramidobacter sp.]|uniref:alpha/beta fold hydrolase n=1 Tax=Pyramidobacter sp. TaxID=1943581 RepID=UPI0025F9873A|nr:alpha/beta fold hydrolase [Pyramidobacter sp.]MCI7402668.1 hypothetical protein [Pyramidobacter sp.]MDY3212298.1 alpha/beta fold hydrolase [Pyramidobacter sp.]